MSQETTLPTGNAEDSFDFASSRLLRSEFGQWKKDWWWFFLLGVLLEACGTAAIVFPALTAAASLVTVVFLGIMLMATGFATILGSYWIGKWSGLLLHLFVGILYVFAGFLIMDSPGKSVMAITLIIAVLFMILGVFRTVGTLLLRYPQWGWSMLNGLITFMAGVVIYRHFPESAIWVIGLLVGLEMLFSGWTWIMIALGMRNLTQETA
jgi:uncharacterized membrane protein HdeD (DUF308 family)